MKVRLFFTTLAISALMAAQLLACNACGEPACAPACETGPGCGQKVIIVRKCDLFAGLRSTPCTPACAPACEPVPAPVACEPVAPAACEPVAPAADCGGCGEVVCCAPCRPLLPLFGPCGRLSQKIRMAACNISNDIECFKAEMDCNIRQAHAEAEARQACRIAARMAACTPACGGCGSCSACDAPAANCEEVAVCVPCRPRPGATLKGIMRTLFGELTFGKCAPACACDTCCPAPAPAPCAPAVAACAPAPCKPVCKPVCAPAPCKPVCKPVCAPTCCKPCCKPACTPAAPACSPAPISDACTPEPAPEVAPEAAPAPLVTPEVAPEAVPAAPAVEAAKEAAVVIPEVASVNDTKTTPLLPVEDSVEDSLPTVEIPGEIAPVNDLDTEEQESILQSEELFPEMPSESSSTNVHFYNASRSIVRK
ncbi:MAG: hypothetical protein Q4D62_13720 [Planctomycetia bacterium]|nr:hypothetical protein [Planctomycetia bacterium]